MKPLLLLAIPLAVFALSGCNPNEFDTIKKKIEELKSPDQKTKEAARSYLLKDGFKRLPLIYGAGKSQKGWDNRELTQVLEDIMAGHLESIKKSGGTTSKRWKELSALPLEISVPLMVRVYVENKLPGKDATEWLEEEIRAWIHESGPESEDLIMKQVESTLKKLTEQYKDPESSQRKRMDRFQENVFRD